MGFVVDFPSMLSQLGDEVVEPGLAMPPVAMVGDALHLVQAVRCAGARASPTRLCATSTKMPHQYLSVLFVSKACCFVSSFKR